MYYYNKLQQQNLPMFTRRVHIWKCSGFLLGFYLWPGLVPLAHTVHCFASLEGPSLQVLPSPPPSLFDRRFRVVILSIVGQVAVWKLCLFNNIQLAKFSRVLQLLAIVWRFGSTRKVHLFFFPSGRVRTPPLLAGVAASWPRESKFAPGLTSLVENWWRFTCDHTF